MGDSVINIGGGGRKHLAKYLPPTTEYVEVDLDGEPDIFLNLERDLPVPLPDRAYDTVVCTDVLEHLDNLHEVFDELVRLARSHVIVSLPNPVGNLSYWRGRWRRADYLPGRDKPFMKYYGLPPEPPGDRHKWYFAASEAETFFRFQTERHAIEIESLFAICAKPRNPFKRLAVRMAKLGLPEDASNDFFAQSVWCILGKANANDAHI